MLEWQIPDRECLKLRIPGFHATLIFMVKLRQAGRHLSTARPRCRDDNKRTLCLDIFILSIPLITHDMGNITWVSNNLIVTVRLDSKLCKLLAEKLCRCLSCILCQTHTANIQSYCLEFVDQAQHIHIICNSIIITHLVILDILCTDHDHDFSLVF